MTASQDTYYIVKKGKKIRKAFAGYITKLANHLIALSNTRDFKDYLTENPEWINYVGKTLSTENKKNETALGGRRVTSEINDAKDESEDHLIFEGNLATVFRKLKEISFDIIPEPTIEELEEQKLESEHAQEAKEDLYLDSQYWKKAEMYSIENIESEFE